MSGRGQGSVTKSPGSAVPAGAGLVTAANEGLSLSATTVILGAKSQLSALPVLTSDAFIPGNFSVVHGLSNVVGGNELQINPQFVKLVQPAHATAGFVMEGTNALGTVLASQFRNLSTAAAASVQMQMYINSSVQDFEIVKHSNAHATYPGGTLLINKGAASAKLVLGDTVTSGTPIISFELNAVEKGRWSNGAFCINTVTTTGYLNVFGDGVSLAANISTDKDSLGSCLRLTNISVDPNAGADLRFHNSAGLKSQIVQYSTAGTFGADLFLVHNASAGALRLANTSGVVQVAIGGPNANFVIASFASTGLTLGLAATATGTLKLAGITSGVITIQPQAAAGTYNFNLPTTAGSVGDLLTSGGGGAAAMTFTAPSALTGLPYIASTGVTSLGGPVTIDVAGTSPFLFVDAANTVFSIAPTGILTGIGGGGFNPQEWRLGDVIAGAAVLDAGQYVNVKINGVDVKLAVIL